MSKKKSPEKAVKTIKNVIDEKIDARKVRVESTDLIADDIWNEIVQAGYIKARYAQFVGTAKIRNHFVD